MVLNCHTKLSILFSSRLVYETAFSLFIIILKHSTILSRKHSRYYITNFYIHSENNVFGQQRLVAKYTIIFFQCYSSYEGRRDSSSSSSYSQIKGWFVPAVSYTHLDVYKRQLETTSPSPSGPH